MADFSICLAIQMQSPMTWRMAISELEGRSSTPDVGGRRTLMVTRDVGWSRTVRTAGSSGKGIEKEPGDETSFSGRSL